MITKAFAVGRIFWEKFRVPLFTILADRKDGLLQMLTVLVNRVFPLPPLPLRSFSSIASFQLQPVTSDLVVLFVLLTSSARNVKSSTCMMKPVHHECVSQCTMTELCLEFYQEGDMRKK